MAARAIRLTVGLLGLLGIALLGAVSAQAQTPTRILFINPAPPEDLHWTLVSDVMRAAASDLGVQLQIEHAFHSGEYTLKHVQVAAQSPTKPHYIIFRNVQQIAAQVFDMTHKAGIRTITIDTPLDEAELTALGGGPRQRYPNWIGQVVPNTLGASRQLAQLLVQLADHYKVKDAKQVIAITGPERDIGSLIRLHGLKVGLKDINDAKLLHAFPGNWQTRKADRQAYEAFRYGADSPIWWSADDNMALGILNVLRNTHRKVGQDTFVGAFHWTEPMMRAILQNQIQYVAGGHFIQGAAALILAHDHRHGRDFADIGVNHSIQLSFLYRKNVSQIGRIMISGLWEQIDFRRFSRFTNPNLAQYDFNVNSYLRAAVGQ